jgi:RHS repeat-associated protein
LQDHQGNNRVVVSETGATEEVNHYYAFGGLFGGSSVQPFKYNGKELDTKKGLNWYDYGARQYDAALGRWFAVDPLSEKYHNISPYTFTGNYGFNVREVNGGLFIFVNGSAPLEYWTHTIIEQEMEREIPSYTAKPYNPSRTFREQDSYGWEGIDELYTNRYNDKNSLYVNASFEPWSSASERYNRGLESGAELLQKLRSGEYELTEGETIKIVGYSMGGAYAAGMAYALMQDPEYAHLLQFVDYLAPYQPKGFSHPNGVLGRQFVSSRDPFWTKRKIENIRLRKTESFGDLFNVFGHSLDEDFNDFINKCLNNNVPIYIRE